MSIFFLKKLLTLKKLVTLGTTEYVVAQSPGIHKPIFSISCFIHALFTLGIMLYMGDRA